MEPTRQRRPGHGRLRRDALQRDLSVRIRAQAGLPIVPPMPVGAQPMCASNYSLTMPPAWRDRKLGWWACSAGDAGDSHAVADMRFFYAMHPRSGSRRFPPRSSRDWRGSPVVERESCGGPSHGVRDFLAGQRPDAQDRPDADRGVSWAAGCVESVKRGIVVPAIRPQRPRRQCDAVRSGCCARSGVRGLRHRNAEGQPARRARADQQQSAFSGSPAVALPAPVLRSRPRSSGELVLEGELVTPLVGASYLLLNCLAPFEKERAKEVATGPMPRRPGRWPSAR